MRRRTILTTAAVLASGAVFFFGTRYLVAGKRAEGASQTRRPSLADLPGKVTDLDVAALNNVPGASELHLGLQQTALQWGQSSKPCVDETYAGGRGAILFQVHSTRTGAVAEKILGVLSVSGAALSEDAKRCYAARFKLPMPVEAPKGAAFPDGFAGVGAFRFKVGKGGTCAKPPESAGPPQNENESTDLARGEPISSPAAP